MEESGDDKNEDKEDNEEEEGERTAQTFLDFLAFLAFLALFRCKDLVGDLLCLTEATSSLAEGTG